MAKESQVQLEIIVMQALNSQGKVRFTFGVNVSVTVKKYQILDYLFEEVDKNESDILVHAGEQIKENVQLDTSEIDFLSDEGFFTSSGLEPQAQ